MYFPYSLETTLSVTFSIWKHKKNMKNKMWKWFSLTEFHSFLQHVSRCCLYALMMSWRLSYGSGLWSHGVQTAGDEDYKIYTKKLEESERSNVLSQCDQEIYSGGKLHFIMTFLIKGRKAEFGEISEIFLSVSAGWRGRVPVSLIDSRKQHDLASSFHAF